MSSVPIVPAKLGKLGEACSHVTALLFKVMSAALYGLNEESRTSMSCVQAMPVEQMNFDNPKPMRVKKRHQRALFTANDEDDFNESEALHSLKHVCPSACILTKEDSDTDSASEDEDMPLLLMRYHEVEHQSLSGQDLREKCERFVRDFQVTPQQANNLDEMTRAQHDSLIWQRHRS
ncbi:hypothetical protein MAR_013242 [Mya arenaria]|uniref:Uncharacterized protein n=1 Tax=Mya arenaria TaxID=6604 RepID=A0ABY7FZA5_MYAAR|nr:hypothetical protein MAR_013242 [Mya arenaria]